MRRALSNKTIYDDFIYKVRLTEDEEKILEMYLLQYSLVKIGLECSMSERTVGRILKNIRDKYNDYKQLELAKHDIFLT